MRGTVRRGERRTKVLRVSMAALVAAAIMPLSSDVTSATGRVGPAGPYANDGWVIGEVGSTYVNFDFASFLLATNRVDVQGPASDPSRSPRVGEVFYIRLATSLYEPAYDEDMTYQMALRLPNGVVPAMSATYPIKCELGTYDDLGNFWYQAPYDSCGVSSDLGLWRFPAATINYEHWSSVIWVPVRSQRAVSDGAVTLLSTRTAGDFVPNPDPVESSVPVTVDATPPWAPRSVVAGSRIRQLAVSWAAPESNGGSPITGYVARAWTKRTGGFLVGRCRTDGARRCTIARLRRDRTFYVDVTAISALGTGRPSSRAAGKTL